MTSFFHVLPPGPALAGWVRQHQIIRFRFPSVQGAPTKPYWPRPASALAFYPRDPEALVDADGSTVVVKPRAALIGQPTILTHRRGGANFCVYQIEFEPGALHRLIGGSLAHFTDEAIDAEAVFPDLRAVADRIGEARAAAEMIAVAEAWILDRVSACRLEADATAWAAGQLIAGRARSLDRLADSAGLNPRTFQRAFRERMGVSPKLFARIARLDRTIRARNAMPHLDWLSVAVDLGYFDHQHMARDFRQLCLASPTAFWRDEQAAPERLFGISER